MSFRKPCEQCGRMFGYCAGDDWKRLCLTCWKSSKREAEGRVDPVAYRLGFDRGYEAGRLAARSEAPPRSTLDPEMGKRLRMLCHPDRHGNSQMATIVTQWLNQVLQ